MDCNTCENHIQAFLDRTLSGEDLRQFLLHVKKCSNCHEELETAYLVEVAIPRIEAGSAINLDKELSERLAAAERARLIHWVLSNMMRSVEVAAGIVLSYSAVRAFILFGMQYITFFD